MLLCFIIKKFSFGLWDIIVDFNLFHYNSKNFLLRDNLTFPKYWYYIAIVVNSLCRGSWLLMLMYSDLGKNNGEFISLSINILDIIRRILWLLFRFESDMTNNKEKYRKTKYVPILPTFK